MSKLEAAGEALHSNGWCRQWYDGADPGVARVAGEANGHLFAELLRATDYVDVSCVEMLRQGACMIGELPVSGVGAPVEAVWAQSADVLWKACTTSNARLAKHLREDAHSSDLLKCTESDAELHRMTPPVPFEEFDTSAVRLQPRFAVVQSGRTGPRKFDPSMTFHGASARLLSVAVFALRFFRRSAGDGGKEGSVNGHTVAGEKLRHDTVDTLFTVLRLPLSLPSRALGRLVLRVAGSSYCWWG